MTLGGTANTDYFSHCPRVLSVVWSPIVGVLGYAVGRLFASANGLDARITFQASTTSTPSEHIPMQFTSQSRQHVDAQQGSRIFVPGLPSNIIPNPATMQPRDVVP